ncbi:hypothetical protein SDC9_67402 [bioreactor metagenome]|uniref:Uncharacterized protein n=1 Tax=bioreactor metagenome TaxID=1076179 RepID=A0A644Y371_9ZZZZ
MVGDRPLQQIPVENLQQPEGHPDHQQRRRRRRALDRDKRRPRRNRMGQPPHRQQRADGEKNPGQRPADGAHGLFVIRRGDAMVPEADENPGKKPAQQQGRKVGNDQPENRKQQQLGMVGEPFQQRLVMRGGGGFERRQRYRRRHRGHAGFDGALRAGDHACGRRHDRRYDPKLHPDAFLG